MKRGEYKGRLPPGKRSRTPISHEIALFTAYCVVNVGKCERAAQPYQNRATGRTAGAAVGGIGMKSRGTATAVAAAIAIAATLAACAAPGGSASTTAGAAFASPLRAPPDKALRAPDIRDLAGLKPADVISILGQPDLRRDEPPAELWQYRAADCVLNLFFYDKAGDYRLTHVEAWQRTLASSGSVPARCHDEDAPIKAHLVSRSRL